ncbi:xanthine dehydrogenase family protein molybdopterin-binding subunit [Variovorax sp. dw_308]|uniref:xanthine dehydrogenase family protein molybdopterin-binding subunit n=1 Tax=Variovorax sp. dw_308 TaxID=2721546 RepID=UPI001C46E180|nr:xanthine dehydrogenase family protein molybdopterin-binding subunit [Variovorax sp. dw_308]
MRRRYFLLGGAAAAGALAVGWAVLPPDQRLMPATPLPVAEGQVALNGWVRIGADNTVTVTMTQAEMGQGIHTGLAMLLAEEIDADWSQIRLGAATTDKIYNNTTSVVDGLPFHPDDDSRTRHAAERIVGKLMRKLPGGAITGGSSSMKDQWLPMREAGASARALLIAAAADTWKLPAAECRAEAGRILHASGKSASFGELAAQAAKMPLPDQVALKDPAHFKLVGQPLHRFESAAKRDGSAVFGLDVKLPGMLHATVALCPVIGGTLARFDAAAANALPGVRKVVSVGGGVMGAPAAVAVIADTPWHAIKALRALQIEWDEGNLAGLSSSVDIDRLAQTLDSEQGSAYEERGDAVAALAAASKRISAEYRAPYLAHATMEPMNCTVQFKDGAATVWAPTQAPGLARMAAARALGIDTDKVQVHETYLGGGFGRRTESDFVALAAAIAREGDGAPVQTFWLREEDMRHDFYRPACVARFEAGFDAQDRLQAWHARSAGQSVMHQVTERVFGMPGMGPDKTLAEGSFDTAYGFPNVRVAHQLVRSPVPVGFWRSVGHSHQAFFKESFIDEAAAAAGKDPLAFRLDLLAQQPGHKRVLQRAADQAGWGQPLAPAADGARKARGLALHRSFGSIVAQVAEVSVGPDKAIRVHRVVCVIDCGFPVNPNLIRQQMESSIVFGLSAALQGEITFEKGRVVQSNFHDYPVMRMQDAPVIETDILPSTRHPEGIGEPGTPPIAPAVANALFTLTGQRIRTLPLKLA